MRERQLGLERSSQQTLYIKKFAVVALEVRERQLEVRERGS